MLRVGGGHHLFRHVMPVVPAWIPTVSGTSAIVSADFANQRYWYSLGNPQSYSNFNAFVTALNGSFTRSTVATDLLPSSATGASFTTFTTNSARIGANGIILEDTRTNLFLVSNAPATQTITAAASGAYTLWVNGTGSATSSTGTGVATGLGQAVNGTPNVFTVTSTGTFIVTVTGSLNTAQVEKGAFGSSFILTTAAGVARGADQLSSTPITWLNSSAFSSVVSFSGINSAATDQRLVSLVSSAGGVYDNMAVMSVKLGSVFLEVNSGGVNQAQPAGGVQTAGINKAAFSAAVNNFAVTVNGAAPGTDVSGVMPVGLDTLYIGATRGEITMFGNIQNLSIFNVAASNAELQRLTT